MDGALMAVVEWSVATRAMPGQTRSGDHYVAKDITGGAFLAVVDSLGHGSDAAEVADLAVKVLKKWQSGSLLTVLRDCQERLKGTRGAVLSMASFDIVHGTMTWLGVGNVAGVLVRKNSPGGPGQEFLVTRPGIVGAGLPQISMATVPISYGDLLILATDGIGKVFSENLTTNASPEEIAQNIIERHWRRIDDALVLVARYVYYRSVTPISRD